MQQDLLKRPNPMKIVFLSFVFTISCDIYQMDDIY